jgi:hypothetical protein
VSAWVAAPSIIGVGSGGAHMRVRAAMGMAAQTMTTI